MNHPVISIITATYNSAATLGDTLRSVAGQSYPNVEHLIIDGASTDDTLAIARSYPHVSRIVSEKDSGIYDAMNKGIALISGDIVGILNSDDVYADENVLENVMTAFDNPEVDAVYGDLQYVRQDDLQKVIRSWRSGKFVRSKFYFGWMPPHPTFFIRSKIYREIGGFNLALRSAADYEFMLRALFKHRYNPVYLPRILVKMRIGGMSNATLQHRLRANAEDRKAWQMNGLNPYIFTIPLKPLRKIFQYINK